MMPDRSHPAVASVTIRRLVLSGAEAGHGLGDAIAAALAGEFGMRGPATLSPEPGVAQAIARGIAGHPELAACGAGPGRKGDGGR